MGSRERPAGNVPVTPQNETGIEAGSVVVKKDSCRTPTLTSTRVVAMTGISTEDSSKTVSVSVPPGPVAVTANVNWPEAGGVPWTRPSLSKVAHEGMSLEVHAEIGRSDSSAPCSWAEKGSV